MVEEQKPTVTASAAGASPADISNKTITILVVLALVVSFIGAWVNIQQAMNLGNAPPQVKNVASAEIGFFINERPQPKTSSATAMVGLTLTQAG